MKELFEKLSDRDKRIILIGAVAVGLYVLYQFVIVGLLDLYHQREARIMSQRKLLDKYIQAANREQDLHTRVTKQQSLKKQIESLLLPSDTPALAVADLQKILREIAKKQHLDIKSITPKNSRDIGDLFTAITVAFPLTGTMSQIKEFIYKIENNSYYMEIPSLRIRSGNPREKYKDVVVDLEVTAFVANKTKTEKEDRNKEGSK